MLLPQALQFPWLTNVREEYACTNTGHCAFEEQHGNSNGSAQALSVAKVESGLLDGLVEGGSQAAAPPLFSRAHISYPAHFR